MLSVLLSWCWIGLSAFVLGFSVLQIIDSQLNFFRLLKLPGNSQQLTFPTQMLCYG